MRKIDEKIVVTVAKRKRSKRGDENYIKRKTWFDKATLCRMIIAIVGEKKYGKKLWNMTNVDLENIYEKEKINKGE